MKDHRIPNRYFSLLVAGVAIMSAHGGAGLVAGGSNGTWRDVGCAMVLPICVGWSWGEQYMEDRIKKRSANGWRQSTSPP